MRKDTTVLIAATMATEAIQKAGPTGFEEAVAGFTLPDVSQLKGLNRFSGSLGLYC